MNTAEPSIKSLVAPPTDCEPVEAPLCSIAELPLFHNVWVSTGPVLFAM